MRSWLMVTTGVVCLTTALLSLTPSSAAVKDLEPRPEFVTGHWAGIGHQGSGSSWGIRLLAKTGSATLSISYPSLRCSGTWTFIKGHSHLAWFRETITKGKKACIDGGTIAVTPIDSDYLTFSYFLPGDGRLASWSTLRRAHAPGAKVPKVPMLPEAPTDVTPEQSKGK